MAVYADKFQAAKGAYITRAGEVGDAIYLIQSGRAEALGNGKRVKIFYEKQMFGIHSCLKGIKKTASVKTLEPTIYLSIGKNLCSPKDSYVDTSQLRGKLNHGVKKTIVID